MTATPYLVIGLDKMLEVVDNIFERFEFVDREFSFASCQCQEYRSDVLVEHALEHRILLDIPFGETVKNPSRSAFVKVASILDIRQAFD